MSAPVYTLSEFHRRRHRREVRRYILSGLLCLVALVGLLLALSVASVAR